MFIDFRKNKLCCCNRLLILWKIKDWTKRFKLEISRGKAKVPKIYFSYKILNGHTAPNLKDVSYVSNERDNACNLRNRETELALHIPKKEFGRRCFGYNAAWHSNNLPQEVKIAESVSVNSFKLTLKRILIAVFVVFYFCKFIRIMSLVNRSSHAPHGTSQYMTD